MGTPVIAEGPIEASVGRDASEWEDISDDDLPARWGDACKGFRVICSNGFVGSLTMESALLHKPSRWPQCFQNGADGRACCTTRVQRLKMPNAGNERARIVPLD